MIESVWETVLYLALFAAAWALLGFGIGFRCGRPKLRRDRLTGRFIGKGSIYGTKSQIQHDVKINSPIAGMTKSKYPVKYNGIWINEYNPDDLGIGSNYDPFFLEIDNE
jgi:hypothetical protein